jgi:hypothetical protein
MMSEVLHHKGQIKDSRKLMHDLLSSSSAFVCNAWC